MKPVLPTNTIPAGKYGQYACADSSHGVEKGPDNVFRVLCLSNGSYQVPTEKDWPVCHTKTTTVSPGWCFMGTSWCFKSMKNLCYDFSHWGGDGVNTWPSSEKTGGPIQHLHGCGKEEILHKCAETQLVDGGHLAHSHRFESTWKPQASSFCLLCYLLAIGI